MLGTNDLKVSFGVTTEDIAKGAETLINMIRKSESGRDGSSPDILVLAPAVIKEVRRTFCLYSTTQ